MTDRFDFSYWPPKPIEQNPVLPAQSSPSDELCRDVLFIQDDARRQAVYASGDWVDIQDFWIETLREPKPEDQYNELIIDTTTLAQHSIKRVRGRRHLQNATYTFHRLAQEVAGINDDDAESAYLDVLTNEIGERYQGDTRAEGFLFHYVFSSWDKQFSEKHVLVSRQAVTDIYDGIEPLPLGVGKDGHVILAKVALKWHANFYENSLNP